MKSSEREPIAVIADSHGAVAEAYRSLRVALSKQVMLGKKVFAFVSAWPGDGKSMVCTNLAVAMSQLHQKVLLIDGDLRRPTISRVFGAHQKSGISEDLENLPAQINTGYATKYPGAFVLPRGLSEVNPANLLAPERLTKIFARLRQEYDIIILDTPPLSACSDALLLGDQCDGVAMVVSPKGWDGAVESRYKQQLTEHGIEMIGVVLNGAMGAESHGYGYGYASGYGYGSGYGQSNGRGYGHYGDDRSSKKKTRKSSAKLWPWQRPDSDA